MRETLRELGEAGLLDRLASLLNPGAEPGKVGDDAAVVSASPHPLVLASDALLEGRHFLPGTAWDRVGRKAVNRTLSDFAAMGAIPRWILVNLAAPASMAASDVELLYEGITGAAADAGAEVVGGDTSSSESVALHVFAAGYAEGRILYRGGASVGDILFVTGRLGGSLKGHHLDFVPRIEQGRWLASRAEASAMTDITDGLVQDTANMASASGCIFELDAGRIPLAETTEDLDAALYDGEDYELLITVSGNGADAFEAAWPFPEVLLTRIGRTAEGPSGVMLLRDGVSERLSVRGYDHFRE